MSLTPKVESPFGSCGNVSCKLMSASNRIRDFLGTTSGIFVFVATLLFLVDDLAGLLGNISGSSWQNLTKNSFTLCQNPSFDGVYIASEERSLFLWFCFMNLVNVFLLSHAVMQASRYRLVAKSG